MRYTKDDERWAAVAGNDRDADGRFVYAVTTTGVFCRPSCPSRRPNRANVRYFDTPAAAQTAGFRPCKSCRPLDLTASDADIALVKQTCRTIELGATPPSLEQLADAEHVSPSHLRRVFRSLTGVTPRQYADEVRRERLRAGLSDAGSRGPAPGAGTISSAIHSAGFESGSRAYATSRETLGMTPSTWRSGGAGELIRFAVAPCYLGLALVAATDRGLCAVELGDDARALEESLRRRFPHAQLVEGDADFASIVAATLAYIESPERGLDLPLDIRGTTFQRLVWDALREIPAGTTASYAEVATRIGRPASARAVAGACASNHLAVAVPCHRVVRSDGDLSGYRWGVERKRRFARARGTSKGDAQLACAPVLPRFAASSLLNLYERHLTLLGHTCGYPSIRCS